MGVLINDSPAVLVSEQARSLRLQNFTLRQTVESLDSSQSNFVVPMMSRYPEAALEPTSSYAKPSIFAILFVVVVSRTMLLLTLVKVIDHDHQQTTKDANRSSVVQPR
ncbi:hypothetical protein BDR03DRAFT_961386 [Suillus americanus]|nr:hypothetical protein BDR03DRAFT_961386 [Suillus americanus]